MKDVKKSLGNVSPRLSEDNPNRIKTIESIKAKEDEKRSKLEVFADKMNSFFGSNFFLYFNFIFFILWLILNTGLIPFIKPFDEFPFSLLTTSVSLEAIILAIFVLISQNRSAKIADIREEVQLQLNILSEEENTKIMQMLVLLLKKNNIEIPNDKYLKQMLEETDTNKIERKMKKQLEKS